MADKTDTGLKDPIVHKGIPSVYEGGFPQKPGKGEEKGQTNPSGDEVDTSDDTRKSGLDPSSRFLANIFGEREKPDESFEGDDEPAEPGDDDEVNEEDGKVGDEEAEIAKEKPDEHQDEEKKPKRGRPPGSKNKKKSEPEPEPESEPEPEPETSKSSDDEFRLGARRDAKKPSGQVDVDAITAATAAAVDRVLSEKGVQPKTEEEKEFGHDLPAEHRGMKDVYFELVQMNPEKYGDIVGKLKEFEDARKAYVSGWRKENPGQKFDSEDPDYLQWVEENSFPIDAADEMIASRKADARAAAEMIKGEVLSKIEERLKPFEEERTFRQVQPKIIADQQSTAEEMLKAVLPGQKDFSEKAVEAVTKDDIAFHEAAKESFKPWLDRVAVVRGVMERAIPYNSSNPIHQSAMDLVHELQEKVKALPDAEKVSNGRVFATIGEYSDMPPERRSKYWTITVDDAVGYVGRIAAQSFAERRKHWQSLVERVGKTYSSGSSSNDEAEESRDTKKKKDVETPAAKIARTGGSLPQHGRVGMEGDGNGKNPGSGVGTFFHNIGIG